MSPRPTPCDGFTGQLPAYADRELGAAETTAVERHLEACRSCQHRLKEIESVGDVLKGWDAQSPAGGTAAARLHHAVLARIQEDGQRRRGEVRVLRVKRLALAAAVLLGVGLPLALGLRERAHAVAEPGTAPYEIAQAEPGRLHAPTPTLPPGSAPVPEVEPFQPWDRKVAAVEGPDLAPEGRDELLRAGLEAQKAMLLEQRFRSTLGVSGVWVVDPANGYRLLLTPEAARFFQQGERLELIRRVHAQTHTVGVPPQARSLGRSAGDLLHPVLRDDEGSAGWRLRARLGYTFRLGSKTELTALPLTRRDEPGAPALHEALDPVRAQDLGLLKLEPSGYDVATVLAVVDGTELPILLPAGHLLSGGETDRVVARSTWLPASPKSAAVYHVPCAVVRSGSRRPEGGIRLTSFLAGPSLRALLAEGASPQRILGHARALRGAAMQGRASLEWSLLELYDLKRDRAQLEDPSFVAFAGHAGAGFVVADTFGRLLGLEHVALRGETGALLAARLLQSYTKEAGWRLAGGARVLAVPGEPAGRALARVRTATTPLLVPPVPPGLELTDVERAMFPDADLEAGLALEALRVEGRAVLVSLLPRAAVP